MPKSGMASRSDNVRGNFYKFASLVALVFQNASQVLLSRYVRTRDRPDMFLSTCAVYWSEVIKLVVCVLITVIQERSLLRAFSLIYEHTIRHPLDTLSVCVPSVIFMIQNNLSYEAVSHLDATTYMVTYQLKLLTTALFSVWILRKSLSWLQWTSLLILFLGVSLVQVDEKSRALTAASVVDNMYYDDDVPEFVREQNQSQVYGFICIIIACCLSGFASVYFEKILKDDLSGGQRTIWMRNIQMSVSAIPISRMSVYARDKKISSMYGLTYGFDSIVWTCIFVKAICGLTVAVVMKYADNVLKGFATSISIVFSCIVSMYIFAFSPSLIFGMGYFLVMVSTFMYSKYPLMSATLRLSRSAAQLLNGDKEPFVKVHK